MRTELLVVAFVVGGGTWLFHFLPTRPLVLIGCLATLLAFLVRRSIVLATIIGAAAYGVAHWILGG